jgi:asparagine synthase (glutamine-hydrolysing)
MCGIAGYAGLFEEGLLDRMSRAIDHRGPDSRGGAEMADAQMAIGISRLSIIDLETGDQPVVSADGCVHLVMNGEIYNYPALRRQFVDEGYPFRSHSDTEVVLAAYLKWGRDAWARLDGMFAIAIVDRREAVPQLVVVRDRVGIKPLYYIDAGGRFLVASEIKALMQWSGFRTDVNLRSIRNYLSLRYVPSPETMFSGVRKFPPASMAVCRGGTTTITKWWQPPVVTGQSGPSGADAAAHFGSALRNAVGSHMIADVPVGAFLSGGIDSGILVALMRQASAAPLHTFSIGFRDFPGDDQQGAAATAQHLGTTHHAIDCGPDDFADLPKVAWSLDEPVGDAIVVPMYVLSREARKHVKVVLSGEGADEILAGYMFHKRLSQLARLRRMMPAAAWRAAAAAVAVTPTALLSPGFDYPGALGDDGRRKVAALLRSTGSDSLVRLYRNSISLFDDDDLRGIVASPALAREIDRPLDTPATTGDTPLRHLLSAQYDDWLPDDILMKADKMSMAHSLELRVPFMDERVIRAAAELPDRSKLSGTTNKVALRDFAKPFLPPSIATGPKRAFYVPLESYRTSPPLRELFRSMLDHDRLQRRGLLRPAAVTRLAADVPASGFLALKRQFAVVMLELWFERFAPQASWS